MIFYHGTIAKYLDDIKARGLIPRAAPGGDAWAKKDRQFQADFGDLSHTRSRDNSVYLTPNPMFALWFARMTAYLNQDKPVVLKVDLPPNAPLIPDEEGSSWPILALRFVGVVSPDRISVMPPNEMNALPQFPI